MLDTPSTELPQAVPAIHVAACRRVHLEDGTERTRLITCRDIIALGLRQLVIAARPTVQQIPSVRGQIGSIRDAGVACLNKLIHVARSTSALSQCSCRAMGVCRR